MFGGLNCRLTLLTLNEPKGAINERNFLSTAHVWDVAVTQSSYVLHVTPLDATRQRRTFVADKACVNSKTVDPGLRQVSSQATRATTTTTTRRDVAELRIQNTTSPSQRRHSIRACRVTITNTSQLRATKQGTLEKQSSQPKARRDQRRRRAHSTPTEALSLRRSIEVTRHDDTCC